MEKWIRLVGLELSVSIGIHDFERQGPQPYRLDIGLRLRSDYIARRDTIAETVDYDLLRQRVKTHVQAKHFNLQETLMQDVLAIFFSLDSRVMAVDVQTAKTAVYDDCQAVGLHYCMDRQDYDLEQMAHSVPS